MWMVIVRRSYSYVFSMTFSAMWTELEVGWRETVETIAANLPGKAAARSLYSYYTRFILTCQEAYELDI